MNWCRIFLLFFCSQLLFLDASSQVTQGWSPWQGIYDDSNVSVEVQFKMYTNSCNGGKKCKFRYRLSPWLGNGQPSNANYVNWKMDYVDCNGVLRWQQFSLNIGEGAKFNMLNESMDYTFRALEIKAPVYEVESSRYPSKKSGKKVVKLSEEANRIISIDTVYQGEKVSLEVDGGVLGEGAEWVWYKGGCAKNEVGRGTSIQVSPKSSTTYYVRAEGLNNKTLCASKKVRVFRNSIIGDRQVYYGQSTTLKVKGAQLSGSQRWAWYRDDCDGTPFHFGTQCTVAPENTTTYYVALTGATVELKCLTKTVTLNTQSLNPEKIEGPGKVCGGESAVMKISGGYLAKGAAWVWYESGCGTKKIGSGEEIQVTPDKTNTYYVRAEGNGNTTKCISHKMSFVNGSVAPEGISGELTICEGESTELAVKGGKLSSGSNWMWYSGSCNGIALKSGRSLEREPSITTTYSVRGEGDCTTSCKSCTVTVKTRSRPPTKINLSKQNLFKGDEIRISKPSGNGSLGTNATWEWYAGSCGSRLIGKGNSIKRKLTRIETIYLRASGDCNSTACKSIKLDPQKGHKTHSTFSPRKGSDYNNKFLHVGGGAGAMFGNYMITSTSPQAGNNIAVAPPIDSIISMTPVGIEGEFSFHPIFKDYFSLGFIVGGGFWSPFFVGPITQNTSANIGDLTGVSNNKINSRTDFAVEVGAGFKFIKLLASYKNQIYTHGFTIKYGNLSSDVISRNVDFELRRESFKMGLRFGAYDRHKRKSKRGVNFDFSYIMFRDFPWEWKSFDWTYANGSSFKQGFAFSMWIHSVLKVSAELLMSDMGGGVNTANPHWKVGIMYNHNSFY